MCKIKKGSYKVTQRQTQMNSIKFNIFAQPLLYFTTAPDFSGVFLQNKKPCPKSLRWGIGGDEC